MLRIVHNQTVVGGILVDDIDDQLPNKEVYRLGSQSNPKAYKRDGYANTVKQPCYIAFNRATQGFSSVAGYITLTQTPRVLASAGTGRISKLQKAGLVSVVTLTSAQVVAPVITNATVVSTNFVITGTTFTSVSPDITTVTFTQGVGATLPSPASFTQAAIVAASGTVGATSISIPLAAFSVAPVSGNTTVVNANEQNSNPFTAIDTPVLTLAHTVSSNFVITGTNMLDLSGSTSVTFAAGTSIIPTPATFTQSAIVAAGGSVTATTITIPNTAFSVAPTAGNTVKVTANGLQSNVLTTT